MNITNELKESYKKGTALTKLIYINLAVFVIIKLFYVILFLFNQSYPYTVFIRNWLAVPSSLEKLLVKPWTIITYMFLHFDFLHILFNILWFYWFGKVFLQYFTGKNLTAVYLLGGIAGAVLYIAAYNIFPVFSGDVAEARALGASAAVMAIAIAISFYVPDYIFNLMFIGPVKIKYIAIVFIAIDILTLANGNAGGHIAHLGGALFGYWFATRFKQGKDITKTFNRITDYLVTWFKPQPKIKLTYNTTDDFQYNKRKADEQAEIDRILDKIAQSGYDNLTKDEKATLFRAGK